MSKVSARWVLRLLTPDQKLSARWVLWFLTLDQKLTRLTLSQSNLSIFEADQTSFLDRLLTTDEYSAVDSGPETLAHPLSKDKDRLLSKEGDDKLFFWDAKNNVIIDYLQKGRTIMPICLCRCEKQLGLIENLQKRCCSTRTMLLHTNWSSQ